MQSARCEVCYAPATFDIHHYLFCRECATSFVLGSVVIPDLPEDLAKDLRSKVSGWLSDSTLTNQP